MTAQILDSVIYRGERYDLIGKRGGELVVPQHFDIEPRSWHTACYRGYVCRYQQRIPQRSSPTTYHDFLPRPSSEFDGNSLKVVVRWLRW